MANSLFLLVSIILPKYLNACSICLESQMFTSPANCSICPDSCDNTKFSNKLANKCFGPAQPCDRNYKYRSADGSCNNLQHPSWGKSNTPFVRLLQPHYEDNNHSIRLTTSGDQLPLARKIITSAFSNKTKDDSLTLLAIYWGQIVIHDMSGSQSAILSDVYCCDRTLPNFDEHCLPLDIPDNDFFYSQYNVNCIGEVRTLVSHLNSCCQKGPAQQINANTHIMDGSLAYGSNITYAKFVRKFNGGRLRAHEKYFLPPMPPPIENACFIKNLSEACYASGDVRVNQNPALAMLQTIMLREHNRIARVLESMHRNWSDEILYQETRAIVIAILQHINYNEFLPLYIGEKAMIDYKLYSLPKGYSKYNSKIKPIVINAFAASAFRFAHSGIPGDLHMCDYGRNLIKTVNLTNHMNRPNILQQSNNLDKLLIGITNQPMDTFDRRFDSEITTRLFHFYSPFGHDLLSLDIQRGRDHGLGPYVHFLEICTGYKARTFEDLELYIPKHSVLALKRFYNEIQDIDLHVGGSLENIVPNTRFGPTFLCISVEQFYRTKYGDRFWYETKSKTRGFTKQQLQEIRKISLAKILCDNTNIRAIAKDSFKFSSPTNPITKCKDVPKINLDLWK